MRGVNLGPQMVRYAEDLARLREAGLIELQGDGLRLTRRGVLLSNEVFTVFV